MGRSARRRAEQRRTAPPGVRSSVDRALHLGTLGELTDLHATRKQLDQDIAVRARRLFRSGVSWAAVGRSLKLSRQGARQRYG